MPTIRFGGPPPEDPNKKKPAPPESRPEEPGGPPPPRRQRPVYIKSTEFDEIEREDENGEPMRPRPNYLSPKVGSGSGQEVAKRPDPPVPTAPSGPIFSGGVLPGIDELMADLHTIQDRGFIAGVRNSLSHSIKQKVEGPTTDAIIERLKNRDRLAEKMAGSVESDEKLRDAEHKAKLNAIRRHRELEAALTPPVTAEPPPMLSGDSTPPAGPHLDMDYVKATAFKMVKEFGFGALDGPQGAEFRQRIYGSLPRVVAEAIERNYREMENNAR